MDILYYLSDHLFTNRFSDFFKYNHKILRTFYINACHIIANDFYQGNPK